jgi:hypothetical protein
MLRSRPAEGAIAANWLKRRLQVRRRFAGSSNNSAIAFAYIEIGRFVKDFLSTRMSTLSVGELAQEDCALLSARLAAVITRTSFATAARIARQRHTL